MQTPSLRGAFTAPMQVCIFGNHLQAGQDWAALILPLPGRLSNGATHCLFAVSFRAASGVDDELWGWLHSSDAGLQLHWQLTSSRGGKQPRHLLLPARFRCSATRCLLAVGFEAGRVANYEPQGYFRGSMQVCSFGGYLQAGQH